MNVKTIQSIVLSHVPTAQELFCARILQKYLDDYAGTVPEIRRDVQGFSICLGSEKAKLDNVNKNGYRIVSDTDGVYISGTGTRGIVHGVYRFLYEFIGCRWFTSKLIFIPKHTEFNIPDNIDITYNPFFECTDTDWISPQDTEYSIANGLTCGAYRKIPSEAGGTVNYISSFCHTLTSQFCSYKKYYADHPEYFSQADSENRAQLCLTNPDVLYIVTSEVIALLKEKHDPNADLQIISLTQNDNRNPCKCERCKASDDKYGSESGTMLNFVNSVAREVAKAGYNNVAIDTFAYQYTRKPPVGIVPDSNVIVRLCSIECCFSHPLEDESCAMNAAFIEDFHAWSDICKRLYIWDYTTNYWNTIGLFPNFGVIQKNIQTFYSNNVKGVYEEGNIFMRECDTEFGELRSYLLSKLMQNPFIDYDETMREFLEAYYGKAWNKIYDFLSLITDNAGDEDGDMCIYGCMDSSLQLTDEQVNYADGLWKGAKELCSDKPSLERVERSEISWIYWKACCERGEFTDCDSEEAIQCRSRLYDELVRFGVTKHHEGKALAPKTDEITEDSPDRWFVE